MKTVNLDRYVFILRSFVLIALLWEDSEYFWYSNMVLFFVLFKIDIAHILQKRYNILVYCFIVHEISKQWSWMRLGQVSYFYIFLCYLNPAQHFSPGRYVIAHKYQNCSQLSWFWLMSFGHCLCICMRILGNILYKNKGAHCMDVWSSFEVTSSKQIVEHNSFYANYPGDKFIVSTLRDNALFVPRFIFNIRHFECLNSLITNFVSQFKFHWCRNFSLWCQ